MEFPCPADEASRNGQNARRIALPGTLNLRDLGGYPTSDGGTVRWRTLLRSDALHRLDDTGRAALVGFGLRTVIDLRTDEEASCAPSALDGTGARVFHVPLFRAEAIGTLPPELAAVYRHMIDDRGAAIAEAVGRLSVGGALPGLIHCSAGKDRTGLVAALVLEVIGVPDEIIAVDYAMSAENLDADMAQVMSRIQAISGGQGLDLGVLGSPPELILEALARVRDQAGSVAGYLIRNGLPRPAIESLRSALVVASPAGDTVRSPTTTA
jgi:protein-tyrosine phosphatase